MDKLPPVTSKLEVEQRVPSNAKSEVNGIGGSRRRRRLGVAEREVLHAGVAMTLEAP